MMKNEIKQATITFIEMIRAYCISKEKCQALHKQTEVIAEKIYITNPEQVEDNVGLAESFGNDLESFADELNAPIERNINTFHASMLIQHQKRKLKSDDIDYMRTFWKYLIQSMNPGNISKPSGITNPLSKIRHLKSATRGSCVHNTSYVLNIFKDVPLDEMQKSKSSSKYALSLCRRRTVSLYSDS